MGITVNVLLNFCFVIGSCRVLAAFSRFHVKHSHFRYGAVSWCLRLADDKTL